MARPLAGGQRPLDGGIGSGGRTSRPGSAEGSLRRPTSPGRSSAATGRATGAAFGEPFAAPRPASRTSGSAVDSAAGAPAAREANRFAARWSTYPAMETQEQRDHHHGRERGGGHPPFDWKDGEKTKSLYPDRADSIVYDVKGKISCICPLTGEQRHLVPWGFEADRGTLEYRCPAVAFDFECRGRDQCMGAQTQYGRIVRVNIADDRHMFTPIPRDSDAWQTAYDRRSAVERVNSRLDHLLGFEHHNIRGLEKMEARIGIALVVPLSMALGRIRAGQAEQTRPLVGPVRRAA